MSKGHVNPKQLNISIKNPGMCKALDFLCNRYASTRTYMIQMLIMECYRSLNREDLRNAAKERRDNYIKTGIPLTKFKNDIDHVLKLNTPRALEDFEREYGVTFSSLDDTLEIASQESTPAQESTPEEKEDGENETGTENELPSIPEEM